MFPKLCLSLVLPATNVVHVYSSYHSRHHILHFHVFYFIIYSSSYFRSQFPVNTRMAAEESYPELLFICLFWLLHAIFSLTEYIMAFCYLLSSKWRSVITQVCVRYQSIRAPPPQRQLVVRILSRFGQRNIFHASI